MKTIKPFIAVLFCILTTLLIAQEKPADAVAILARVDNNEVYNSINYKGTMIIEYKGKHFEKTFNAWGRKNKDSFIEFTNTDDKGTKYLKKEGRLYVYSPDTEQVMLISGHMLKESMMGSDMSYEDAIENETLTQRYTPKISGSENVDGRDAWILELSAKKKTESYQKQKLWVAKDNHDVLRNEYYALSGAKLKEYRLIRSQKIGGRSFPVEMEMKDLLRKNSRTVFKMDNIKLDVKVADSIFSMRNLER